MSAKINLALSALPSFNGVDGEAHVKLSGRIHIGPDIDYLERAFDAAKYGDYSPAPYLDITIPSLVDSSLAPAGAHVMSVHAQYAPFELKQGDWNSRREEFADNVVNTLSAYAPNLKELIARAPGDHAIGFGADLWIERWTHSSRRTIARSVFYFSTGDWLGAISHANQRTLSLWRRHASGRWGNRRTGRECRARNHQGFQSEACLAPIVATMFIATDSKSDIRI